MALSILRCELNTDIAPEVLSATVDGAQHLWRVWVDSTAVADTAMPFAPTDNMVELEAQERYAVRGDGHRLVSVQRAGDYVIWMYPQDPWGRPGLSKAESYVFRLDQYLHEIDRCLRLDVPDVQLDGVLPELGEGELRTLLRSAIPGPDDPLYTTPSLPHDPRGQQLVARVKHYLLDEKIDVQFSEDAADVIDVTIGLDAVEYQESHWRLGRIGDSVAIQFVSRPAFGLWFHGACVDEAVGDVIVWLRSG